MSPDADVDPYAATATEDARMVRWGDVARAIALLGISTGDLSDILGIVIYRHYVSISRVVVDIHGNEKHIRRYPDGGIVECTTTIPITYEGDEYGQ